MYSAAHISPLYQECSQPFREKNTHQCCDPFVRSIPEKFLSSSPHQLCRKSLCDLHWMQIIKSHFQHKENKPSWSLSPHKQGGRFCVWLMVFLFFLRKSNLWFSLVKTCRGGPFPFRLRPMQTAFTIREGKLDIFAALTWNIQSGTVQNVRPELPAYVFMAKRVFGDLRCYYMLSSCTHQ